MQRGILAFGVAAAAAAAAVWAIRRRLREAKRATPVLIPPRLVVIFSGKRKSGKVRQRRACRAAPRARALTRRSRGPPVRARAARGRIT